MQEIGSISLFGGLQVEQAGRRITHFRTYKTGALLAYLAFYPNRPHAREVLAEMFWPESDAGRLSLRVAVGSLRRQLEPAGTDPGSVLAAERACLSLNSAAVRIDVSEFEAALRFADTAILPQDRIERLMRAVELYRGPLLPGYYEDWILPERERLGEAYLGALHQLCTLLEAGEDLNAALAYGHRAVIAASFQEEAHLTLMRLYRRAGRPAEALRHYTQLEQALTVEWSSDGGLSAARRLAAEIRRELEREDFAESGRDGSPTMLLPETTNAGRLPRSLTRLFGREAEIASLQKLCSPAPDAQSSASDAPSTRLITITGPGGMGKTRVATEVAHACAADPQARVWFVPLADIVDPSLLPDAVAAAIGVRRAALADPMEQICQALAGRPALLILDNMEHLLAENLDDAGTCTEGRAIVQRLLAALPGLILLITSRQSLEIEGEAVFPLASLPTPDAERTSMPFAKEDLLFSAAHRDAPEALAQVPSVRMFVDRARSVRPDFQLTARNAEAIAALCTRLEGVPLFIELAAAWAQTYTPAQMLSDLDPDRLLTSRRKDRPARHRSGYAVVDWSFQLLPSSLGRFFVRLSVFAGGWTLDAAAEICEEPEVMSALGELHARSMIMAEERGGTMRYRLPEALRQYAASRLQADEKNRLMARHAAYFLEFAERAEQGLIGVEQKTQLERLVLEQDNLRAALAWSRSSETGVRLAGALCLFWEIGGGATEGRRRLNAALADVADPPTFAQARALAGQARLAALQGDLAEARACGELSRRAFCRLRKEAHAAAVGTLLSRTYHTLGESEKAATLLSDCLAICRRIGGVELADALLEQGRRHGYYGEYAAADACLLESRELFLQLEDRHGVARVATEQAIIQQYRQDFPKANDFYEQAFVLFERLGDPIRSSEALHGIGYVARLSGDLNRAGATLEKFLALQRQMVLKKGIVLGLRNLGCVVRDKGDYRRAMLLFEEALMMARAAGERQSEAETLGSMAIVALYSGDNRQARFLHEKCLAFRHQNGFRQDVAESLGHLGFLDLLEGDLIRARARWTESLNLYRAVGVPVGAASQLSCLSMAAQAQGEIDEAFAFCRESLNLHRTARGSRETAVALEQMAHLLHIRGAPAPAACLLAASETLRVSLGFRRYPLLQSRYEERMAALRQEMEPERLSSAQAAGTGMTIERAVAYALEMSEACRERRRNAGE